ncbi:MAG: tetratricopeptide repeat protein [Bacteroidetes bacterium]|nr:tetratricopeptide repeat protein [Bacteroidota bacterium]
MKKEFIINIIIFFGFFVYTSGQNQTNSNIEKQNTDEHVLILLKNATQLVEDYPDSSLQFSEPAYDLAIEKNEQNLKYEAAKLIADACFYINDLTRAIEYYRLAAQHAWEVFGNTSEEYASRISDVGYCFYVLQIYDLAIEHYRQALELFQKADNYQEVSNQINNIGSVYFNWGKYNLSIEYYSRSLKLDLEQADSIAISISYNNIGKVYESWGYYDIAIEHYQNSLQYLADGAHPSRRAVRLSNIGTSFYKMGDYDEALNYLNEALGIDQLVGDREKVAVRNNEIASVLFASGDPSTAIEYNQKALQYFRSVNRKESLSIVLKDMGAFNIALLKYEAAEKFLKESLEIAHEIGSMANEMATLKVLADLYEVQREYKLAMMYHKRYDDLRDTIFNARIHKQLANYRIRYETEKKEQENQLLRRDILFKKRTQRTLIIIGSAIFVVALLLFLLLRLKTRTLKQSRQLHEQEHKLTSLELEKKDLERQNLQDKVFAEKQLNRLQREKYETEIKLKNRELVASTLQLVNKNEVLSEIKDKVNHTQMVSETRAHEIVQIINHNTDSDRNWKHFMLEFEQIHPGFVDRMRRVHPDFSEQFIRLSMLLRMELSTREIAHLLSVSIAAVNKNRQRLRKKLNLEAEANLSDFMKTV